MRFDIVHVRSFSVCFCMRSAVLNPPDCYSFLILRTYKGVKTFAFISFKILSYLHSAILTHTHTHAHKIKYVKFTLHCWILYRLKIKMLEFSRLSNVSNIFDSIRSRNASRIYIFNFSLEVSYTTYLCRCLFFKSNISTEDSEPRSLSPN